MFKRLTFREGVAGNTQATNAFIAGQDAAIGAMTEEAFNRAADTADQANKETLQHLVDLGDILDVADLVQELNTHRAFQPTPLECRPLSWVPHAPATIDEATAVCDGVKAVRGWAISPADDKPHRLGLFVALYNRKQNDTYTVPNLVSAPLYYFPKADQPGVSIEKVLTEETSPAYTYLELQDIRARQLNPTKAEHEAVLTDYYQRVQKLGHALKGPEGLVQYELAYWELGLPGGDPLQYRGRPLPKLTLADHVKAAGELLDIMPRYAFGADSGQFHPSRVAQDSVIHESEVNLPQVEALFAPARTFQAIKKYWTLSRTTNAGTPAGLLGQGVPVHNPSDARLELIEAMDIYYEKALS